MRRPSPALPAHPEPLAQREEEWTQAVPGGWHFHRAAHRQSHTICDTRQTDPLWGRATKCYLLR